MASTSCRQFSNTVSTSIGLMFFLALAGAAQGWSPNNHCPGINPQCDFGMPTGGYGLLWFSAEPGPEYVIEKFPIRLLATGEPVISATSDDSCFSGEGLEADCRKQFFVTGNKVARRALQVESGDYFCGKCFKLKLTNVQLPNGMYLNPNDNNPSYPESRRCVFFGTHCEPKH